MKRKTPFEKIYITISNSSTIQGICYDEAQKELYVKFNTGEYKYMGVPKGVYSQLMEADSHGTFLSKYIKGMYEYTKI